MSFGPAPFFRAKTFVLILLFASLVLLALPGIIDPAILTWLVEENGGAESLSVIAWLLAAVYLLWASRPFKGVAVAFAIVFVALAIREAGLPPEIVPSGSRLLKLRYYLDGTEPLVARAITGAIVLSILVSILYSCVTTLRYLLRAGGYRRIDGQLLMLAFMTLAFSQLAEAVPAMLARQGLASSAWDWGMSFLAVEEGLECLASLFVIAAIRGSVIMARGGARPIFPVRHAYDRF